MSEEELYFIELTVSRDDSKVCHKRFPGGGIR